ncbi:MAG: glycerol-3-phosphate acyltransferase [Anaerolineales bacterium]
MNSVFDPISLSIVLGSYIVGSFPFALLLARLVSQKDLREHGSGHSGATNVLRTSGFWAGLIVLGWDIGKGFLVITLAQGWAEGWVLPAAAFAVVAGHCWPVFAGFKGGMGVATSGGVLLAIWPLAFVIGVGLIAGLTLLLRHAARANLITGVSLWLLLLILGAGPSVVAAAAAVGAIVAVRASLDWNREYRELWLDRSPEEGNG